METKNKIEVKPYNIKELATIYGVGYKTMKSWLKPFENEIGQKRGRALTVKQVEVIFNGLGVPYSVDLQDLSANRAGILTFNKQKVWKQKNIPVLP